MTPEEHKALEKIADDMSSMKGDVVYIRTRIDELDSRLSKVEDVAGLHKDIDYLKQEVDQIDRKLTARIEKQENSIAWAVRSVLGALVTALIGYLFVTRG